MEEEHPIESLMQSAMDSIRDMIDVNTIIGEAIQINENITLIPISNVGFGFVAGGSEFKGESIEDYKKRNDEENITYRNPFGGGSGAGVSIKPVAILTINGDIVKILPVEHNCSIDKILDYMPELFEKTEKLIDKMINKNSDKKEDLSFRPKVKKADITYKYDYNKYNKYE